MSAGQARANSWASSFVIREILEEARTVAIVGISDNPARPSYGVARFLIESGYRVVGVNPNIDEVLGTLCYPSLTDVPEPIDVVNVFRKSGAVNGLINQMIKLRIPYLWLQEGVVDVNVADRAAEAGIKVVMDRCLAKELTRLRF